MKKVNELDIAMTMIHDLLGGMDLDGAEAGMQWEAQRMMARRFSKEIVTQYRPGHYRHGMKTDDSELDVQLGQLLRSRNHAILLYSMVEKQNGTRKGLYMESIRYACVLLARARELWGE
ncbi:hypothetical protein HQ524_03660 [Candidatus Uhrbacteria bacterium]|nr:hypothetical protein [Candidatus Uhrbacteria bacterium]